jgi:hypothetical protein
VRALKMHGSGPPVVAGVCVCLRMCVCVYWCACYKCWWPRCMLLRCMAVGPQWAPSAGRCARVCVRVGCVYTFVYVCVLVSLSITHACDHASCHVCHLRYMCLWMLSTYVRAS